MEMIRTNDPKVALTNITRANCERMHTIQNLMSRVMNMKNKCGEDGLFRSARTPEVLDHIMEELIYIFGVEANCDVAQAGIIADGGEVEIPKMD